MQGSAAMQLAKARLAVDHRHFAERLPRRDNGDEPRRIPPVLLEHFDSALDEKTHEIARLAFADDSTPGSVP